MGRDTAEVERLIATVEQQQRRLVLHGPDNDTSLERKTRVVIRFGAPSSLVGLRARVAGTTA
jgi:uncharacterized protein (UPF0303 family)